MKRFVFKLQAVLTLRQRNEHVALEKYSCAIRQKQLAALHLTEVEMELSETRRQWLNALADGVPAAHAAQMQAFCGLLEERKQQCEQLLRLAESELNQAGRRMLRARQQREAVETLLARQRERYDRLQREAERRELEQGRKGDREQGGMGAGVAGGQWSMASQRELTIDK